MTDQTVPATGEFVLEGEDLTPAPLEERQRMVALRTALALLAIGCVLSATA
ncbi:hypothetical protein ACQ86G_11610 [Roseateles chitinivorans]|uniref:hypothetical protein n=1 Tax=Roseateles chitinivorans TaxID=2917965 RepID=UPI003D67C4DD